MTRLSRHGMKKKSYGMGERKRKPWSRWCGNWQRHYGGSLEEIVLTQCAYSIQENWTYLSQKVVPCKTNDLSNKHNLKIKKGGTWHNQVIWVSERWPSICPSPRLNEGQAQSRGTRGQLVVRWYPMKLIWCYHKYMSRHPMIDRFDGPFRLFSRYPEH